MVAIFASVAIPLVVVLLVVYVWALLRVRAYSEALSKSWECKHGVPKPGCIECWLGADWTDPDLDRAWLLEPPGPGERGSKHVDAAYHEGVQAYDAGRPRWENPFNELHGDQSPYDKWDNGWLDAYHQRETGK